MEGSAETWACSTALVLHCPCPRALLEEECHALEREIPILQVSCSPGPPHPQPLC